MPGWGVDPKVGELKDIIEAQIGASKRREAIMFACSILSTICAIASVITSVISIKRS